MKKVIVIIILLFVVGCVTVRIDSPTNVKSEKKIEVSKK